MTNQRFEIVRQTHNRYSWLFVEVQGGQRRVLARGGRDYGSPKKVRRAIHELQGAVPDADVADAAGSTEPERFALPTTSFRLVPGVIPLVVEESPVERDIAVARRRKPKRPDSSAKLRKRTEEAAQEAAVQEVVAEAAAQEAAVQEVVAEAAAEEAAVQEVVAEAAAQEAAVQEVVAEAAAQEAAVQEAAKAKATSRDTRRRRAK